ncbi:MAG: type II toxin-antitoxin system VapB family antitoxin [Actinomycetota bacterium]
MRTTLTIDDDLAAQLHAEARATGRTFRAVVNQALRDGLLREADQERYEPPVHELGIRPGVDLTKALQLVGQMEDEEVVRKMETGK